MAALLVPGGADFGLDPIHLVVLLACTLVGQVLGRQVFVRLDPGAFRGSASRWATADGDREHRGRALRVAGIRGDRRVAADLRTRPVLAGPQDVSESGAGTGGGSGFNGFSSLRA
ncbi:MAG: hypothetical protein U0R24_09480 [Solirubrobacterales bacterium]